MKKHTILTAGLTAALCFMTIGTATCFAAADNAVEVSAPTYYKDGAVVSAPEKGKISTQVTVTNKGTQAHEVILITAVSKKDTGSLVEISAEQKTLSVGDLSITLQTGVNFSDPDTTEYHYYVWDENRVPLGNCAPGAPGEFKVSMERMYGINLTWNASDDDKGIIDHYEIGRANVTEGAELSDLQYSILNADVSGTEYQDTAHLENGVPYAYKIVAYDNFGLASDASYTMGTTAKPLYGSIGHAEQADALKNSDGVVVSVNNTSNSGDNYTGYAEAIGPDDDKRPCRFSSVRDNGTSSFLYFSVDTKRILPTDNNLTIAITYFDQGTGNITLHYNSIGTAAENTAACYKSAARTFALTDSGQWKTAYIHLTDASFQNIQGNYGTSARVIAAKDKSGVQQPFYVSEIRVIQTEKWMELPTNAALALEMVEADITNHTAAD